MALGLVLGIGLAIFASYTECVNRFLECGKLSSVYLTRSSPKWKIICQGSAARGRDAPQRYSGTFYNQPSKQPTNQGNTNMKTPTSIPPLRLERDTSRQPFYPNVNIAPHQPNGGPFFKPLGTPPVPAVPGAVRGCAQLSNNTTRIMLCLRIHPGGQSHSIKRTLGVSSVN